MLRGWIESNVIGSPQAVDRTPEASPPALVLMAAPTAVVRGANTKASIP